MKNKRGLGQVVSTILLILLSVAAVAAVGVTVTNFAKNTLGNAGACNNVLGKVKLNPDYTCYDSSSNTLVFSVSRKEIAMDSLLVAVLGDTNSKVFYLNSSSKIENMSVYQTLSKDTFLPGNESGTTYCLSNLNLVPKEVQISPKIKGAQCRVADKIDQIPNCMQSIVDNCFAGGAPTPSCGDGVCSNGEDCSTCSPDCGQCQSPPSGKIYFLANQVVEAENGTLVSPMVNDTSGSTTYVYSPTAYSGYAKYEFNITTAGKYVLQTWVYGSTTSSDSFFIGLDNQPAAGNDDYAFDTGRTSTFYRKNATIRGPNGNYSYAEYSPAVYNLTKGLHNFTFYTREAGTELDKIELLNYVGSAPTVPDSFSGTQTCNNDGIIDPGEQCDNGTSNGVACTPAYNSQCTYCDSSCQPVTVIGPYCGDGQCTDGETSTTCSGDCGGITYVSLSDLRNNFVFYMTGSGTSSSDQYVSSALNSVKWDGENNMNSINPDGSWSDLDYGTSSGLVEHAKRIHSMAMAYKSPGQYLYQSSTLKTDIENALNYLDSLPTLSGSPYNLHSALPLRIAEALVLVDGDISSSSLNAGIDVLSKYMYSLSTTGRSNYAAVTDWVQACYAIVTGDTSKMNSVKTAMTNIMSPNYYFSDTKRIGSVGLKPDSSYLDHDATLYIGGYGVKEYGSNMAKYVYITSGTQYAISSSSLNDFSNFISDGLLESINNIYFDPSVTGRTEVDGLDGRMPYARIDMGIMSEVSSTRNSDIVAQTKKYLNQYSGGFDLGTAGLVTKIKNSPISASYPNNNIYYPYADLTIHRRNNFYMSIKTISDRSLTSDTVSNMNLRDALGTDGRMHLTLTGSEYAGDILPTMDWSRLPGVTVEQRPNSYSLQGQPSGNSDGPGGAGWPGKTSFVGGVSDGSNGVSVMDFVSHATTQSVTPSLSFRKSWFLFDDYAVFVTNNIQDSSGYTVETVVDQRPLLSSSTPIYVDGVAQPTSLGWSATLNNAGWVTANNVGYYFPNQATLNAKRTSQSGSWSQLSSGYDTTTHTNNFFTLWYDHGTNPSSASALYIVVPNKDQNSMPSWVSSNNLNIVKNDNSATAMSDSGKGLFGIVFWSPTSVSASGFPTVTADTPSVAMITKSGSSYKVDVEDPNHGTGTMTFTFSGTYSLSSADNGISVTNSGGDTIVSVTKDDPYAGANREFTLS